MTKEMYSRRKFIKYSSVFSLGAVTGLAQLDGPVISNFMDGEKKHIVFLISKDVNNYEAHRTIPEFAEMLEQEFNYQTTVLLGEGERTSFHFPGLEVIKKADLVTVFCRRVALSYQQMKLIQDYFLKGKPLLGIRTANHAFSVRAEVEEGYTDWWGFVPDILGCKNRGYASTDLGQKVHIVSRQENHPIFKGAEHLDGYHSLGSLYLVAPLLHDETNVLIKGTGIEDEQVEPIAWTRTTNYGSHIFYTSLGHPSDFKNKVFLKFLSNGIEYLIQSTEG